MGITDKSGWDICVNLSSDGNEWLALATRTVGDEIEVLRSDMGIDQFPLSEVGRQIEPFMRVPRIVADAIIAVADQAFRNGDYGTIQKAFPVEEEGE